MVRISTAAAERLEDRRQNWFGFGSLTFLRRLSSADTVPSRLTHWSFSWLMLSVTSGYCSTSLQTQSSSMWTGSPVGRHASILYRPTTCSRRVIVEVMKQLISAFIFSRLDYCSAILSGLPLSTIAPLQRRPFHSMCIHLRNNPATLHPDPTSGCSLQNAASRWPGSERIHRRLYTPCPEKRNLQ